jgi:hypothetical protein
MRFDSGENLLGTLMGAWYRLIEHSLGLCGIATELTMAGRATSDAQYSSIAL